MGGAGQAGNNKNGFKKIPAIESEFFNFQYDRSTILFTKICKQNGQGGGRT